MEEFSTEEEYLFGEFLNEIFQDGLLYTYSKKAYLEIFKKKLEKSDSKDENITITKRCIWSR